MTIKIKFAWNKNNGDLFHHRVILVLLLADVHNPATKVSMKMLRNKISNTNSAQISMQYPGDDEMHEKHLWTHC